ncbi:MAG: NADP-dependent oxidoreductase [Armatimonadota bacterium]
MSEKMKAVRIHAFGGVDTLVYEDAPRPRLGARDALVRVHAAGVNPVDWKVREGYLEEMLPHTLPLILGWDLSGIVEAVGEEVTEVQVGDAVFADAPIARDGAYAEYIAVNAALLAPKPKTLSHIEAASLPVAALTVWQALFETAKLEAGQSVLIHAAAGGVGSLAVQMAKWKGAHVIGTASARNHDFLRGLGADELIDYNTAYFDEVVRDVDVVFDTMGYDTLARSWDVLKPGGFLVGIVSVPDDEEAKRRGVRSAYVFTRPDAAGLSAIAALVDAGTIKPIVGETLPLADARRAHEISETKHSRGKIVLQVIP